ncbi:hypothetical protein ANN_21172 [Periplaneta americana]|uniref:Uncharacterized protein n=1 Tax=Periplaneta americana TaxID=6978 RepID=A0ABQ8SEL4_PERAM|nr:hypothetical protein ANN_21172 [Periplaneta americana]
MTATVLLLAYSATFISVLSVRKINLPFVDFKTMVLDGTYKLRMPPDSATQRYFEEAKDPYIHRVYKKLIEPYIKSSLNDEFDGILHVCNEDRSSYITSVDFVRLVERRMKCRLVEIPHAYYPVASSMIIRKTSPYRRIFSYQ